MNGLHASTICVEIPVMVETVDGDRCDEIGISLNTSINMFTDLSVSYLVDSFLCFDRVSGRVDYNDELGTSLVRHAVR